MSVKKLNLPKTFICASIRTFCHSNAAVNEKNLRVEVAVETLRDPHMIIDTMMVTDKNASIIIPILDLEDLVKFTLLNENKIVNIVTYSMRDFEQFKGNCFAQWSVFPFKNKESKDIKESGAGESSQKIVKILFEFIVDTAGNINTFQQQRDKLGEISEKASKIEDTSIPDLSQDYMTTSHDLLMVKKEELLAPEKQIISEPVNGQSQKQIKETQKSKKGESSRQSVLFKKSSLPRESHSDHKSKTNTPTSTKTLARKEQTEQHVSTTSSGFTAKTNSKKNPIGPPRTSSVGSVEKRIAKTDSVAIEMSKDTFCEKKKSINGSSQQEVDYEQPQQLVAQQHDKLSVLNHQLLRSLENSEDALIFKDFLGQMDSFAQEFRKIQAENDSLKEQIKNLEEDLLERKMSSNPSKGSLHSTESKSSQETPPIKTLETLPQNIQELYDKLSHLERKLHDKDKELSLLREENKLLNSNNFAECTGGSQEKKKKYSYSDDLVAKMKAENDKLKEILMKENTSTVQIKLDLQKQVQQNQEQDLEIKKMNQKMEELQQSLQNTTKSIAALKTKKGKSKGRELSPSFGTTSPSHNEKTVQNNPNIEEFADDNSQQEEAFTPFKTTLGLTNSRNSPATKSMPQEVLKINFSGDGLYDFGSKKVYIKKTNGALFARTGGGFVTLQEFLSMQKEIGRNGRSPTTTKFRSLTPQERKNNFLKSKATQLKPQNDNKTPSKSKKKKKDSHSPPAFHTPKGKENMISSSLAMKNAKTELLEEPSLLVSKNQEQEAVSRLSEKAV